MKKILFIGANGFLGRAMIARLFNKHRIYAIDRYSHDIAHETGKNVTVIKTDLDHDHEIPRLLKKHPIDYVFEFAGKLTPASSLMTPEAEMPNICSQINRFKLYADEGVKRIILPSSGGTIYQSQNNHPYKETDTLDPQSPYALSSLIGEKYLHFFHQTCGLNYLVFRISSVYGEGQNYWRDQGVISIFIRQALSDLPLTIYGNIQNQRDFIHIDDVADLITRVFDQKTKHRTYNLGNGKLITLKEVIDQLQLLSRKKLKLIHKENRYCDYPVIGLDIERIQTEFEYVPKVSLSEGVERLYQQITQQLVA